jgi:heat shock protein HslJ
VRAGLVVVLAALAMTALAGACTPGSDNANGGLANTSWVVGSIAGTATLDEARPTMSFAPEGTVSGSDGCNQYTGTFRTDGSSIEVSQLGTTLMGCDPPRMAQAQAFGAALSGATDWRLTEANELELRGHGDLLATPADATAPIGSDGPGELGPSSWVLVDLDGSTVDPQAVPTLAFAADGTVSGFGGCNTYGGPFSTDGGVIAIGPLAATEMACEGPGSGVESVYLPALDAVGRWEVMPNGQLVLTGPQVLTYRPG